MIRSDTNYFAESGPKSITVPIVSVFENPLETDPYSYHGSGFRLWIRIYVRIRNTGHMRPNAADQHFPLRKAQPLLAAVRVHMT